VPPKPDLDPRTKARGLSFSKCDRFLGGHGRTSPKDVLQEMLEEVDDSDRADYYGHGSTLNNFEAEIAGVLGKEAAVFMPSGTMAQQVALRIWSDETHVATVAFHPTCHLELHIADGLNHLHEIERVLVGDPLRLITLRDLEGLAVPVSALLLELPQREIGGYLPTWDELVSQCQWAREKGIKLHMDGARLWESQPYYQRPYDEISSLFDSVYVSCYKGFGGLAGAVLAGSKDFIAQARVWLQRHGGGLIHHYPTILSARAGYKKRIGRFQHYHEQALKVAEVLSSIPGVSLKPNPPHAHMMHVYLKVDRERALDAAAQIAQEHKVQLFFMLRDAEVPGFYKFELCIGDAVDALEMTEIKALFTELMSRATPPT
jgi:threonine aldolase